MIVLDASALVDLLAVPTRTNQVAAAITNEELLAPELLDTEVVSALWRMVRGGQAAPRVARRGVEELAEMPIERVTHVLLDRLVWELRERVAIADAFYVACAQLYGATLVTTDARLARAPLPGVSILLVR